MNVTLAHFDLVLFRSYSWSGT